MHGLPPRPTFIIPAGDARNDLQQQAAYAAQVMTASLQNPYYNSYNNPYGQAYNYSSHYAQAYAQPGPSSRPLTTPEGYSISSTYVPDPVPINAQRGCWRGSHKAYGNNGRITNAASGSIRPFNGSMNDQTRSLWYEAGNAKCSREGCPFSGSKKSVETHMMDRHFIFPSNWDKRKRKDDWDADPSLKGKRLPVQGTNVYLDTPEAIEAWIAERKKRFPSATRIAEKKQSQLEAIAKGLIMPDDSRTNENKRRRTGDVPTIQRGGNRGRARGGGGLQQSSNNKRRDVGSSETEVLARIAPQHPPTKLTESLRNAPASSDTSSSDSGSDVDMEKDVLSSKQAPPGYFSDGDAGEFDEDHPPLLVVKIDTPFAAGKDEQSVIPIKRKHANQPKGLPFNTLGHRPSLLRNLLLPEIRTTVSNFSQAIRFIVENDFFENVELKPGDASAKLIEVVSEEFSDQAAL